MPEIFTLTLNKQMMDVIGAALGEVPYRISAPVIMEINKQLSEIVKNEGDHARDNEGA